MNITILAFYPFQNGRNDEKQILQGTIHIILNDFDIELRGIFVSKRKDSLFISLPNRLDDQTGLRYPVFGFIDKAKTNELIRILREKGKEFIERYLAENPQNVQESPPIQEKTQKMIKPTQMKESVPEAKKSPPFAMLQPGQYSDLPKRKSQRKGGAHAKSK